MTDAPFVQESGSESKLTSHGPFALGPRPTYLSKATSPSMAPQLRMALMHIGSDVLKLLANKGKTPEGMAKDIAVDVDHIYQIISGREADVNVRELDAIATYLGARFVPQLTLPEDPAH